MSYLLQDLNSISARLTVLLFMVAVRAFCPEYPLASCAGQTLDMSQPASLLPLTPKPKLEPSSLERGSSWSISLHPSQPRQHRVLKCFSSSAVFVVLMERQLMKNRSLVHFSHQQMHSPVCTSCLRRMNI